MSTESVTVEVLAAVFTVRPDEHGRLAVHVLLWQRAKLPDAGRWALPGGPIGADEDVDDSARRQLAGKVELTRVTHLEQIGVFSQPHRVPGTRTIATGFLGLVPMDSEPPLPHDTVWHPVNNLPATAFDHGGIVARALERLRAKLSYTNIAFGLAPDEFTVAELGRLYSTALGHPVDPTNMQRILSRRGMLVRTGGTAASGTGGGRPAALFRFAVSGLRVTDPFAVFRPPGRD